MASGQALYILVLVFQMDTVFSVSCGLVTSTNGRFGYLSSPSKDHGGFTKSSVIFSGNYLTGSDCTYNIIATTGTGIRLMWKSFDINGNMPDCSHGDYVEIFIGCGRYNSIGKYCSSNAQSPFDMYSPDNCMRIKFHSDSSNSSTGNGFLAYYTTFSNTQKYRKYQCTTGSSYGALMTGSRGIISSSNWPYKYPVLYSSCYYKISVGSGRNTKVVFMDFDLERDRGCDDTKIKIKVGGSSYSRAHRTIKDSMCGSKRPFSFTTGEDKIHIRFKTGNINLGSRGFIAGYVTYKTVLGHHGRNRKTQNPTEVYKTKVAIQVHSDNGGTSGTSGAVVGIIIAIIILIIIVVATCVIKKCRERQRMPAGGYVASVPLAPTTNYPGQPPPQQSYPPSYGQATAQPYPPPGQEKPPLGSYPVQPGSQAPYPQGQGYYPPPGSQPYPSPGGQPYPPPGGQPYPAPGGQPYPPPGGQPYPPPAPGGQYPPPEGQPYPPPGGPAPPYPT